MLQNNLKNNNIFSTLGVVCVCDRCGVCQLQHVWYVCGTRPQHLINSPATRRSQQSNDTFIALFSKVCETLHYSVGSVVTALALCQACHMTRASACYDNTRGCVI